MCNNLLKEKLDIDRTSKSFKKRYELYYGIPRLGVSISIIR